MILDTYAARVATPESRVAQPPVALPPADQPSADEANEPAGEPPPDRVELLYPMVTAGVRFRLIGDPAVPNDLSAGDDPRRVLLAGRYGACSRVPDARGGALWEVRLEPGSAFLWTGADTLAAVGFDLSGPDGAAVRAVLARQANTVGLAGPRADSSPRPATAP